MIGKLRFNVAAVAAVALVLLGGARPRTADSRLDAYRSVATRIIQEATSSSAAWDRVAELSDMFPGRLSGSQNLELAIRWAADQMRRDGLENVRLEKVMVPRWVRGSESAEIVEPTRQPLVMAALGGSVGTGPEGIQAEVVGRRCAC